MYFLYPKYIKNGQRKLKILYHLFKEKLPVDIEVRHAVLKPIINENTF